MIFGRPDDPDGEIDEGEGILNEEAPVYISLHHHVLATFGGETDDGLLYLTLPQVSIERARMPVSPAMPPLPLPAPFDPDSLRLEPPPGVTLPAGVRPIEAPAPRLPFPIVWPEPSSGQLNAQALEKVEPGTAKAPARSAKIRIGSATPQPLPQPVWAERIDPLVVFVFYLALGAGIALSGIEPIVRYTMLWTLSLGIGAALALVDSPYPISTMSSASMLWGFGIGLLFGIMGLIVVRDGLAAMTQALFPNVSLLVLFQSLVLIVPLAETLFFRGVLQDRRGAAVSIGAAGVNHLLFFLPIVLANAPILGGVGIFFLTGLAGVYSYVRSRYGLSAALVCQITTNLMLLVMPALIVALWAMLRTP